MFEIIPFLSDNRVLFRILHLLALTLGMGSALLADIFLLKFIKNFQVGPKEADILKTFSRVVWFGLFLFLVSGIALTLPKLDILQTAKFQVKLIATSVIIINGVMLNILIVPNLVRIFGKNAPAGLRKLTFGLGAISITSWGTAFVFGAFRTLQINFAILLEIYIVLLFLNILVSQFIESRMFRQNK